MGFFTSLVGGGIVETAKSVGDVIDKFVQTDDEKAVVEQIKMRMAQEPQLAQIELNKIEAGHRTIFVAGWRPALGWICALGVAFVFIANPLIQWFTGQPGPELPTDIMFELVLGMLGLGGLRSFDKYVGTSK